MEGAVKKLIGMFGLKNEVVYVLDIPRHIKKLDYWILTILFTQEPLKLLR
jgi:hypothetical protein